MPPTNPQLVPLGATYTALGNYIGVQSPYGSRVALPSFEEPGVLLQTDAGATKQMDRNLYLNGESVKLYGISAGNNAGAPVQFMAEQALLASLQGDEPQKVMHWETNEVVNGQRRTESHLVTKAMRVWYTYQTEVPDENNPGQTKVIDVGTFLLIGYVGHGQP